MHAICTLLPLYIFCTECIRSTLPLAVAVQVLLRGIMKSELHFFYCFFVFVFVFSLVIAWRGREWYEAVSLSKLRGWGVLWSAKNRVWQRLAFNVILLKIPLYLTFHLSLVPMISCRVELYRVIISVYLLLWNAGIDKLSH